MGEKDPADLPLVDFAEEHTREFRHWCVDKGGDLSAETPNEWSRQARCDLPDGKKITIYPVGSGPGQSHTPRAFSDEPEEDPEVNYHITVDASDWSDSAYYSNVDGDDIIFDPDMDDMEEISDDISLMGIGHNTAVVEGNWGIAIRSGDNIYTWKEDSF